jgi:hypothetical protein
MVVKEWVLMTKLQESGTKGVSQVGGTQSKKIGGQMRW